VMAPVLDAAAREKIRTEVLEPFLSDNSRARDLLPDGSYVRRTPASGELVRDAQQMLIERLSRRGLRAVPAVSATSP
ncbi:MAG: hypothetical protein H7X85_07315, partial [Thermoanaerobaculia bacterium]|nr:hypothetical protein [Thermoanaerobaculia bacterium]